MRSIANGFMTEPVQLITTTIAYDIYGQQSLTTIVTWSGLGYVGRVSGRDRELLNQLNQHWGGRDGIEYNYTATILLPFEVLIEPDTLIHTNGYDYDVIWCNNETQNTVQLYTKLIVRRTFAHDRREIDRIPDVSILPGMRIGAFSVPPTYTVTIYG